MLSQVYMFFLTIFNIIILLQYFCFPPWIPFQLLPSNLLQIHNLFSVIVSECINTHIHIVCIMLIVCMFSKLTIWDWTTNLCAVLRRRPPLNIWESCVIVGFDWIRKQLQNFTAASSPFYSHFYLKRSDYNTSILNYYASQICFSFLVYLFDKLSCQFYISRYLVYT